jgi:hypothetical protein
VNPKLVWREKISRRQRVPFPHTSNIRELVRKERGEGDDEGGRLVPLIKLSAIRQSVFAAQQQPFA